MKNLIKDARGVYRKYSGPIRMTIRAWELLENLFTSPHFGGE